MKRSIIADAMSGDAATTWETRILGSGDRAVLDRVLPGVFDGEIEPRLAAEFLDDGRHHLAVAVDQGRVIGFASAVHYVHPDKPSELWINEVGVAPTYQGRGVGKAVMQALLDHGRHLGCREAWVLTERANQVAMRLYASAGGQEAAQETVMFTFPLDAAMQQRKDDVDGMAVSPQPADAERGARP